MVVKSIRKLAEQLGLSHTALNKHFRNGVFKEQADGGFDVEGVRAAIKRCCAPARSATVTPAVHRPPAPEPDYQRDDDATRPTESFSAAQTRKEIALANLRELEEREKRGELVELAKVNAFVAGMVVKARDRMLRIGQELRDRLAQETDPNRCEEMVTADVSAALAEMTEYPSAE